MRGVLLHPPRIGACAVCELVGKSSRTCALCMGTGRELNFRSFGFIAYDPVRGELESKPCKACEGTGRIYQPARLRVQ